MTQDGSFTLDFDFSDSEKDVVVIEGPSQKKRTGTKATLFKNEHHESGTPTATVERSAGRKANREGAPTRFYLTGTEEDAKRLKAAANSGHINDFLLVEGVVMSESGETPSFPTARSKMPPILTEPIVRYYCTISKVGHISWARSQHLLRMIESWINLPDQPSGLNEVSPSLQAGLFIAAQVFSGNWTNTTGAGAAQVFVSACRDHDIALTLRNVRAMSHLKSGFLRLSAIQEDFKKHALDVTEREVVSIMCLARAGDLRFVCWLLPIVGSRVLDAKRCKSITLTEEMDFVIVEYGLRKGESTDYSFTMEYPIPEAWRPLPIKKPEIYAFNRNKVKGEEAPCLTLEDARKTAFYVLKCKDHNHSAKQILSEMSTDKLNKFLKVAEADPIVKIKPVEGRHLTTYSFRRYAIQQIIIRFKDPKTKVVDWDSVLQFTLHKKSKTPRTVYDAFDLKYTPEEAAEEEKMLEKIYEQDARIEAFENEVIEACDYIKDLEDTLAAPVPPTASSEEDKKMEDLFREAALDSGSDPFEGEL